MRQTYKEFTDSEFTKMANNLLDHITEVIENNDQEGNLDIDLNDNILTIINNDGTFVINKQSAAKEIWLSSPVTGPYHFAFNGEKWISKSGDELFAKLTKDLKMPIS